MAGNVLGAFNFVVDLPAGAAGFCEVCGIEVDIGVIEYRQGNDPVATVRKMPGIAKYPNITLKRAVTADHSLWDWTKQALQGSAQRVDVPITLLNDQRQPVARWIVRNAWVCKYQGPTLNATGNDVAMESVELCHEGLDFVVP